MEIDGEMVRQIVLSGGAAVLFIVAAVYVSSAFGETTTGGLTPTGGLALIGVLAGFILLMALAGLWLDRQDFD